MGLLCLIFGAREGTKFWGMWAWCAIGSVGSFLPTLHVVDERTVGHHVSAWGGVVPGEVPVAHVIWACPVEVLYSLEHYGHIGVHLGVAEQLPHVGREFLVSKGGVDGFHAVLGLPDPFRILL